MTIAKLFAIYKNTGCGKEALMNAANSIEKKIINLMEEEAKKGNESAYYTACQFLQREINSKNDTFIKDPKIARIYREIRLINECSCYGISGK